MSNSNIYSKLQKARCEFQEKEIKKSGKNGFAKFGYFELKDFQGIINTLLDKYHLYSHITFDKETAALTIINSEKPEERVVFTSPMAGADLKGCHEVQNLGAALTYLRRYLWQTAFEIVESDTVDSRVGEDDKREINQLNNNITNMNVIKIKEMIKYSGFSEQSILDHVRVRYNAPSFDKLSDDQTNELIRQIKARHDEMKKNA